MASNSKRSTPARPSTAVVSDSATPVAAPPSLSAMAVTAVNAGRAGIVAGATFLYAIASSDPEHIGRGKRGISLTLDDGVQVTVVTLTDASRLIGTTDDTGKRYARLGAIMARFPDFGPEHAEFGTVLRSVTARDAADLFDGADVRKGVTLAKVVKVCKAITAKGSKGTATPTKSPGKGDTGTAGTGGTDAPEGGSAPSEGGDNEPAIPNGTPARLAMAAACLAMIRAEDMTPATADAFRAVADHVERLQSVTVARSPKSVRRTRTATAIPA